MKKVLVGILIAIVLISAFGYWYKLSFSMDEATKFTRGHATASQRLLFAYQGSPYKYALIEGITNHFASDDFYLVGMDVSGLNDVDPKDWTAVLICHTWEMWQPPKSVKSFTEKYPEANNVVYFTTSGDGNYKLNGIDAITSASDLNVLEKDINSAVIKLEERID